MTDECKIGREGGLWGIIVIFVAFNIQVIAFGTSQSIGVYNIELLRVFKTGAAAVSLVGSINLGMFLGAGPVCSVLMSRWSHRQVALLGAVLSNLGLIFMPWAPNLPYMYAFYGILTGLGYCLVYVPSHILSGLYYSKHRSMSTGIATAGSGFGSTIFPIIIYKLINHYGWRGSLLLMAGFNLHLFIFAALLRPVPKELLKAYSLKEKGKLEYENLINTKQVKRLNGSVNSSPSHFTGDVVQIKELNSIDSSPVKSIHDCHHGTQIEHIDGKQDEATTSMLNSSNEMPHEASDKPLISTYRTVMIHFKMVFKFDFVIYWLSNVGWNAGGGILLIFLPKYMTTVGLSDEDASLAIALFGAGSCVGCVIGGLLGNTKCCNRIYLYIGGNFGVGIFTFLFPLPYFHSFVWQLLLVSVSGLMFGIILGLLVVVTSDLLGTEALGYGFGYLMLANGIGIFCGPPLSGVLIDHFGYQEPAIYLSGAFSLFGGIVMCIVPICGYCSSGETAAKIESKTTTID